MVVPDLPRFAYVFAFYGAYSRLVSTL